MGIVLAVLCSATRQSTDESRPSSFTFTSLKTWGATMVNERLREATRKSNLRTHFWIWGVCRANLFGLNLVTSDNLSTEQTVLVDVRK